jgi:hypothetical protein
MTITGNRETRDTGTQHEKRKGRDIAGNAGYSKRTSRKPGDGGAERHGKHDIQERDAQKRTGTRQRQRAYTDMLFPRLLSK